VLIGMLDHAEGAPVAEIGQRLVWLVINPPSSHSGSSAPPVTSPRHQSAMG
jgi:hypothetical protein